MQEKLILPGKIIRLEIFKSLVNSAPIIKILHWEFWPFNVVYAPVYPYWLWLALKSRSFFFFNAANPSITNGGFLMESKKEVYDLIPDEYYPPTVFFTEATSFEEVNASILKKGMKYPLVAKPNLGEKGRMVKTIHNESDLKSYCERIKEPFLVQEWVEWEKEIGLFYYRNPNEKYGQISGIVEKLPLTVTGDGIATLEQLIKQKKRAILQWNYLKKEFQDELKSVLPKGEKKVLVSYGNHIRGSKFIDVSHFSDEKLNAQINKVCLQIPEFHYGRLDIRFNTWEELKEGKKFSIIEVNGSGSEPTHIYDPNHSIFFAWKEIIRHWKILQKVSWVNHQKKAIPFMTFSDGMKMLKEHKSHLKNVNE